MRIFLFSPLPWRCRRYAPLKHRLTPLLHGATSQKTAFFIVTAVKTWNLTFLLLTYFGVEGNCVVDLMKYMMFGASVCLYVAESDILLTVQVYAVLKWINVLINLYIYIYRTVAKQWPCKQQTLLGNACNIHACSNKTMVLCNLFHGIGSVSTPTTIQLLLAVFYVHSVQSRYKEDNWGVIQLVESWKPSCEEKS
jgi:hypothetical protein